MSEYEKLIAQSDIVKECAKHLIKKIKNEKKLLESDKKNRSDFGYFDDCGDFYVTAVIEREARIKAMVEQKISLEKFYKKLKHSADELIKN